MTNSTAQDYCEVHPHVQELYPCCLCRRQWELEDERKAQTAGNGPVLPEKPRVGQK